VKMKPKFPTKIPLGKIKRIVQMDEEIGKVSNETLYLMEKSVEIFVKEIMEKTLAVTQSQNQKTITPLHLKTCAQTETLFDFLSDIMESVGVQNEVKRKLQTKKENKKEIKKRKYVDEEEDLQSSEETSQPEEHLL